MHIVMAVVSLRPEPFLVAGSVVILLLGSVPAGASSVKNESAPQLPAGSFSGTQMAGGAVSLKFNESAPGRWTRVEGSGPPPRSGYGISYDAARGLVVLFGGESATEWFNDTWTYSPATGTWTEMRPAVSPPARSRTSMVYDSASQRTVIFGGYVPMAPGRNDTWAYDTANNTWTDMVPPVAPEGRYAHAMAYDSANEVTVLFGGKTGPEENDTWTYDLGLNSWKNMAPAGAPPSRMSQSMSFDEAHGMTILFGGYSGGGMVNDTWSYNITANNWVRKGLNGGPDARENQAMDYDPTMQRTVLFGGWSYSSPDKSDTWSYDAGKDQWTARSPALAPSARSWHRLVNDPGRGVFLLFGGLETISQQIVGDTWTYDPREYLKNGTYYSKPFDTGGKAYFGELDWNASTPGSTSLKFQFRTSESLDKIFFAAFVGPDGTSATYFERSGLRLHFSHNGSRCFQSRAFLSSSDASVTPALADVAVHYNLKHELVLLSPVGGETLSGKVDISWSCQDPDGNNLTVDIYLLDGNGSTLLASGIKGAVWSWDTTPVWRGTCKIRVDARDDDPSIPLSASAVSGDLKVTNNHPPAVTLATPDDGQNIGANVTLGWTGSDADGDPITYSVYLSEAPFDSSFLPFPRANIKESSLRISDLVSNRTYHWAVLPNDGLEPGKLSEVRRFTVNQTVGNRPPRITTTPAPEATVGEEYVYLPEAVDDDHDPLNFSLVWMVAGMAINPITHKMNWTPEQARSGESIQVVLRVTDGRGGVAEQNFTIRVINPRSGCHFISPGDGETVVGRINITGNATKAQSEVLRVELRLDDGDWLTVTGTYQWRFELDTEGLSNGEHRLSVRAFDGRTYSETESINMRVLNPQRSVTVDGFPWSLPVLLAFVLVLFALMVTLDIRRDRLWRKGRS